MGAHEEPIEMLAARSKEARNWRAKGWFAREQPAHEMYLPTFRVARCPVALGERDGSHVALTYDSSNATGCWTPGRLAAGQALGHPEVLYKRLGVQTVEAQRHRLEPTE